MPIGLGASLGIGGGRSATSSGAPSGGGGCPPQPSYTYDLGVDPADGCTLYGLTVVPAIHLDASDMNGNGDDNSGWSTADAVTTWADRSGNGNDVTQASSGSRPVYRTGLLRGMPGVEFDGTDDVLADADFFDDVGNEPVDWSSETGTIVAVVIPGADGSGAFGETAAEGDVNYGITDTASVGGYGDYGFYTNGATYSGHFLNKRIPGTASNLTIIPSSTRPFINGVKVNGSGNYEIFYNKKANFSVAISALSATAWGPDTTNGLRVGRSGASASFLKGFIPELLIFNTILSDTDWDAVHTYLAAKYGMNVLAARPGGAYDIGSEEVSIAPQFHFDASEANTVLSSDYTTVTDGNPAYLWKDKVHGWYASQPVAAKQPSFAENQINTNKHGIYFDGTGEAFELWMIQTLGNYLDADKAVFVVLEPESDSQWSFMGIGLDPGNGYFYYSAGKTYDGTLRATRLNNVDLSDVATTGAQMIGIWSEEGAYYNITSGSGEDDVIAADTSAESWSTTSSNWGTAFTQIGGAMRQPAEQTGQRFKGWIYEILIWDGGDGVLTSADKTALSDYATAKYGTL